MTRQFQRFEAPSRREVLKGAAAVGVVAATSAFPGARQAALAASPIVRGYGVTTSQLKDWSIMEKAIGITMEFTPTNADIGVFMRDVISNDLGDDARHLHLRWRHRGRARAPGLLRRGRSRTSPSSRSGSARPTPGSATDLVARRGQAVRRAGDRQCRQLRLLPRAAIGANPNGLDEITLGDDVRERPDQGPASPSTAAGCSRVPRSPTSSSTTAGSRSRTSPT